MKIADNPTLQAAAYRTMSTNSISGKQTGKTKSGEAVMNSVDAMKERTQSSMQKTADAGESATSYEGRIRDVDMARDLMISTMNDIVNQPSTAMLAQANQTPQDVLELLM